MKKFFKELKDTILALPGIDIKQYRNALANQGRGIGELQVVSP